MIKVKYLAIIVILFTSLSFALQAEISQDSIDFSQDNKKLIIIETETSPLLISYQLSSGLKNSISIQTKKDTIVTKTKPLILELHTQNPREQASGFIMINSFYQELPTEADTTDDTVIIPINLNSQEDSLNKLYIKLSEPEVSDSDVVELSSSIIVPIVILIILLLVFKKKWKK